MRRIGIVGGGIAGVTAAYHLAQAARHGTPVEATLFESTGRLGGIVETVHEGGFSIECGPDAWVTEKPWAHDLATELGLAEHTVSSLDDGRKTYIWLDGRLQAMPDGMRMMVPADLAAVHASSLFSDAAKESFKNEIARAPDLRASAPGHDESVASFVERHFGPEVLHRIAAPLLSGVFGGDVARLSVRAVMPGFVAMEREFGSLILGVQSKARADHRPIFTTLAPGMGAMVDRMVATIPLDWVHLNQAVTAVEKTAQGWAIRTGRRVYPFDALLLAAPVDVARNLLAPTDPEAACLMEMDASSAVVAGLCFDTPLDLPPGFGFLVPPAHGNMLLACTFTAQKFPGRVPPGGAMLRAFFGGAAADRLIPCGNDEIAAIARWELARILGPIPAPVLTVVRRWPRALPQYAVGHLDRMAALDTRVRALGGLWLLGNGYRGVGLPDIVRDARSAVEECLR